jgi:hypothetical protein
MTTVPVHKGNTILHCEVCGGSFTVKNSRLRYQAANNKALPRFCSVRCRQQKEKAKTVELPCPVCGKLFTIPGYRRTAKNPCCSYKCMGDWRRTGGLLPCAECGKKVYVSGHRLRRHKTYFCQNSCRLSYQFRNNKSWNGFVESSIEYRRLVGRIRKSAEVVNWKNAVINRDGKCMECGSKTALNAHHTVTLIKIIADNDFDEARTLRDPRLIDVSKGLTLCGDCHANRHGLQSRHEATHG